MDSRGANNNLPPLPIDNFTHQTPILLADAGSGTSLAKEKSLSKLQQSVSELQYVAYTPKKNEANAAKYLDLSKNAHIVGEGQKIKIAGFDGHLILGEKGKKVSLDINGGKIFIKSDTDKGEVKLFDKKGSCTSSVRPMQNSWELDFSGHKDTNVKSNKISFDNNGKLISINTGQKKDSSVFVDYGGNFVMARTTKNGSREISAGKRALFDMNKELRMQLYYAKDPNAIKRINELLLDFPQDEANCKVKPKSARLETFSFSNNIGEFNVKKTGISFKPSLTENEKKMSHEETAQLLNDLGLKLDKSYAHKKLGEDFFNNMRYRDLSSIDKNDRYLFLHHTAIPDGKEDLAFKYYKQTECFPHADIDRKGNIREIGDPRYNIASCTGGNKKTHPTDKWWHPNRFSLNIEIQNTGIGEKYTPQQIESVAKLSIFYILKYDLQPKHIASHGYQSPDTNTLEPYKFPRTFISDYLKKNPALVQKYPQLKGFLNDKLVKADDRTSPQEGENKISKDDYNKYEKNWIDSNKAKPVE